MKNRRFHAVIISLLLHIIFAAVIALFISDHYSSLDEDPIDVKFVKPNPVRNIVRRTHRTVAPPTTQQTANQLHFQIPSMNNIPKTASPIHNTTALQMHETDELSPTDLSIPNPQLEKQQRSVTTAQRTPSVVSSIPSAAVTTKTNPVPVISPKPNTSSSEKFGEFLEDTFQPGNLTYDDTNKLRNPIMLPQGILGGILEGTGNDIRGHIRIIRLKHSLSDWWQDPTALPALIKWMDKRTTIRADMSFEGGSLPITNPKILDAPLIVMTGHDKDITVGRGLAKNGPIQNSFTPAERAALRKYIVDEGGMLFFDDCGFRGLFAHIVAEELKEIFPEYPLEILPHDHELYTIHFHLQKPPNGGDVFWGNENNAQPTQFRFQKGITIDNRLAVVFNRKDYMCAMETAEIESRTMLRLRHSPDVYRFMTNLLIYALKYGGNTDRTKYSEK